MDSTQVIIPQLNDDELSKLVHRDSLDSIADEKLKRKLADHIAQTANATDIIKLYNLPRSQRGFVDAVFASYELTGIPLDIIMYVLGFGVTLSTQMLWIALGVSGIAVVGLTLGYALTTCQSHKKVDAEFKEKILFAHLRAAAIDELFRRDNFSNRQNQTASRHLMHVQGNSKLLKKPSRAPTALAAFVCAGTIGFTHYTFLFTVLPLIKFAPALLLVNPIAIAVSSVVIAGIGLYYAYKHYGDCVKTARQEAMLTNMSTSLSTDLITYDKLRKEAETNLRNSPALTDRSPTPPPAYNTTNERPAFPRAALSSSARSVLCTPTPKKSTPVAPLVTKRGLFQNRTVRKPRCGKSRSKRTVYVPVPTETPAFAANSRK